MSEEGKPDSKPAKITVLHGGKKHCLDLPSTLGQLGELVATATGIPSDEQNLIIAGRKLQGDAGTDLATLGLAAGKKIMVMPNRRHYESKNSAAEVEPLMQQLREQEDLLPNILSSLSAVRQAVEDLAREDATEVEKTTIRTDILRIAESCMRSLEVLDSMSGPNGDWREKRKRTVVELQKVLESCDTLGKELKGKSAEL